MDSDSDEVFVPNPKSVDSILSSIRVLDELYGVVQQLYEDEELNMQARLRHRRSIIAEIKKLHLANQADEAMGEHSAIEASAARNKRIKECYAERDYATELITLHVVGKRNLKMSILSCYDAIAHYRADLALAQGGY